MNANHRDYKPKTLPTPDDLLKQSQELAKAQNLGIDPSFFGSLNALYPTGYFTDLLGAKKEKKTEEKVRIYTCKALFCLKSFETIKKVKSHFVIEHLEIREEVKVKAGGLPWMRVVKSAGQAVPEGLEL